MNCYPIQFMINSLNFSIIGIYYRTTKCVKISSHTSEPDDFINLMKRITGKVTEFIENVLGRCSFGHIDNYGSKI